MSFDQGGGFTCHNCKKTGMSQVMWINGLPTCDWCMPGVQPKQTWQPITFGNMQEAYIYELGQRVTLLEKQIEEIKSGSKPLLKEEE